LGGSAYKNKGVQPLIDAVCRYLPNPTEVTNQAFTLRGGTEVQTVLHTGNDADLCALAFKLDDTPFGQLTYTRVYQGMLSKGLTIYNSRTGKKHRVGRLGRIHAAELSEIDEAGAGDIVALFGIDCASGDTFHGSDTVYSMRTMHVPEPVVSRSIMITDKKNEDKLSKALGRFAKEDPTFRISRDDETLETIVSGMGELHLDVYRQRIVREYKCPVEFGAPRVRYREAISKVTEFSFTYKKQTGGRGQYAKIEGVIEPLEEGEYEFVDGTVGGSIPKEYIKSVESGFRDALVKGTLIGSPVVGIRVTVDDGNSHAVDSSEMAFRSCARQAFVENYTRCGPVVLEPVMSVQVEIPEEFQGRILGDMNRRRGTIVGTRLTSGELLVADAEVPLGEMFNYSNDLRSATEGKGEFSMEFGRYSRTPNSVQERLVKEFQDEKAAKRKN
jgi:elongation factor G